MATDNRENKELSELVQSSKIAGTKAAEDISETLFKLKSIENLELFRVGKPSGFRESVDPDSRIRWHMESKMSVIDIIPCAYMIPLTKAKEVFSTDGSETSLVDTLTPHISYGQAVQEFQKICENYGLATNYGGLRLYLTDQTTATDDFSNTYSNNFLDTIYNQMVDKTKTFREIGRSVSSNFDQLARPYGRKIGGGLGEATGGLAATTASTFGSDYLKDIKFSEKLKYLGEAVGAAVASGNRLSLPKLWSDSNYNPNVSAVVKLVSPYGHPDAITEFIIKPLMYLLIMASPRTSDGLSYGHTPKITMKGYGMVHLPLAHISNINLRKGGTDTSYNIYRQPLSIDVSLQFESLVSGFAVYADENRMSKSSETQLSDTNKLSLNLGTAQAGKRAFFPTLGTIVDSIRPVAINKLVTKHNIQDLPISTGLKLAEGDFRTAPTPVGGDDLIAKAYEGNADSMEVTSRGNTVNQSNASVDKQYVAVRDPDTYIHNFAAIKASRA
jgi:hypothetical protein